MLISLGVIIVVGVGTAFIVNAALHAASGSSAEDKVNTLVEQVDKQVQFPMKVDSVTTWTGIEAENEAVHYDYTIAAGVDPSTVTTDLVRGTVVPSICASSGATDALDAGIDFTYTYAFEGTDKTLDFTITKADCG